MARKTNQSKAHIHHVHRVISLCSKEQSHLHVVDILFYADHMAPGQPISENLLFESDQSDEADTNPQEIVKENFEEDNEKASDVDIVGNYPHTFVDSSHMHVCLLLYYIGLEHALKYCYLF